MAKAVAEGLAARDIIAIDAPVSGGVAGAVKGTLAVMTSGPKGNATGCGRSSNRSARCSTSDRSRAWGR
jgi:3-hydroxyisobutyrate dehydrogenase-like beta-hydroxyacid dehydrogenase